MKGGGGEGEGIPKWIYIFKFLKLEKDHFPHNPKTRICYSINLKIKKMQTSKSKISFLSSILLPTNPTSEIVERITDSLWWTVHGRIGRSMPRLARHPHRIRLSPSRLGDRKRSNRNYRGRYQKACRRELRRSNRRVWIRQARWGGEVRRTFLSSIGHRVWGVWEGDEMGVELLKWDSWGRDPVSLPPFLLCFEWSK